MKEFKIRASALGQLMSNPRTKADKEAGNLSQTAKSYLEKWLKEQLYDRRISFSNKYTTKGIEMEDKSIEFLSDVKNQMMFKNEAFFENDYMTGTPDIILGDKVIDIKNSWSFETFPLFDSELKNKDYWWQGQAYMVLCNKQKFEVAYTLTDTPTDLIEREISSHCYKNNVGRTDEVEKHFLRLLTYSDVADNLRLKSFEFELEEDAAAKIEAKVLKAREYINELLNKLN